MRTSSRAMNGLACLGMAALSYGQCELETIVGPNGRQGHEFGTAITVVPAGLAVGAPFADGQATGSGNVTVFSLSGNSLTFSQELAALDGAPDDRFGASAASYGNWLFIGAPGYDFLGQANSGSVSIFRRPNGADQYSHEANLVAGDWTAGAGFGAAIDVRGSRAAVGAPGDDDNGANSGSVYTYRRIDGIWTFTGKLVPPDGAAGDGFGTALMMINNGLFIGAPSADSGKVYFYRRLSAGAGYWEFDQIIEAENASGELAFGSSLCWLPLMVGAPLEDSGGQDAGAVYRFYADDDGNYYQNGKLVTGLAHGRFGSSIDIQGGRVLIGAPGTNSESGRAYSYAFKGFEMPFEGYYEPAIDAPFSRLGQSVAIAGDLQVLGAPNSDAVGPDSGSLTTFTSAGDICYLRYCPGQACPCGPDSPQGGCPNSLSEGAHLLALGTNHASQDDLMLRCINLPPGFGGFAASLNAQETPFGNGHLCIGPSVLSLGPPLRVEGGQIALPQTVLASGGGQITADVWWYLQAWYRDPQDPCGGSVNFSDALAVNFIP